MILETKKTVFDQLDGQDVMRYTLVNDHQTRISVLSYGGTWQEFVVSEDGVEHPLIWGLDNMTDYQRVNQLVGLLAGLAALSSKSMINPIKLI